MAFNAMLDFLRSRKQAYKQVFCGQNEDGSPSIPGEVVLEDLAKFCHAHESAFQPDERTTLILLGRQEVFARIQHQLHMTDDQLYRLYTGKTPSS